MLTRHKVAIKILNRRKIQAMDMEEKGERVRGGFSDGVCTGLSPGLLFCWLPVAGWRTHSAERR